MNTDRLIAEQRHRLAALGSWSECGADNREPDPASPLFVVQRDTRPEWAADVLDAVGRRVGVMVVLP